MPDAAYRAAIVESRRKLLLNRMDHDLSTISSKIVDPDRDRVDLSKDHDPPVENFYVMLAKSGEIWGRYKELFLSDPYILKAGEWRVPPWVITSALKRKGLSWVRRQIDFVANNRKAPNKARYLSAILARNAY